MREASAIMAKAAKGTKDQIKLKELAAAKKEAEGVLAKAAKAFEKAKAAYDKLDGKIAAKAAKAVETPAVEVAVDASTTA